MEHLSRMAPECEAEIAKYQRQVAELEARDLDFFLTQRPDRQARDPEFNAIIAAREYERNSDVVRLVKRELADPRRCWRRRDGGTRS
jgi:hypothetical protein